MSKFIFTILIGFSKFSILPCKLRRYILRMAGIDISKTAVVCSGVVFQSPNVHIGDNTLINKNSHIYSDFSKDKAFQVYIGNNVKIAFDVCIATPTHTIGTFEKRCGNAEHRGVVIEDGSWIGMRATILPGCTVGKGCVVGGGL